MKVFTPKTPVEKLKSLSTSSELMVSLLYKHLEQTADETAEASNKHEIDVFA